MPGFELTCPFCERTFSCCRRCWRNHRYCSRECSLSGRRLNRRLSEKKYAASPKGRESRRLRQKNFRIRKILLVGVTDQSRNTEPVRLCTQKPVFRFQQGRCVLCKGRILEKEGAQNEVALKNPALEQTQRTPQ